VFTPEPEPDLGASGDLAEAGACCLGSRQGRLKLNRREGVERERDDGRPGTDRPAFDAADLDDF
jgi:hypothetical protein